MAGEGHIAPENDEPSATKRTSRVQKRSRAPVAVSVVSTRSKSKQRKRPASTLSDSCCEKVANEFKVPDHAAGGRKFGSWTVNRLRFSHENEKKEITLLSTLLGNRMVVGDAPSPWAHQPGRF